MRHRTTLVADRNAVSFAAYYALLVPSKHPVHAESVVDGVSPEGTSSEELQVLRTTRDLDARAAGNVIGASRGVIDGWCTSGGLACDEFPGKRPARLISERDVVKYALGQPRWRRSALAVLAAYRSSDELGARPKDETAHEASATSEPSDEPGRSPSAAADDAASTKHQARSDKTDAGADAGAAELARLRSEAVLLRQEISTLIALLEEAETSNARKSALWLADARARHVPGNTAALDGLDAKPDAYGPRLPKDGKDA